MSPLAEPADSVQTDRFSPARIALLGAPNTGKTTLFNRLTGLRQKTANFPGTTIDAHTGRARLGADGPHAMIVDLPGVYSLELDQLESRVCRDALTGATGLAPDAMCVLLDASSLRQSLRFLGEATRRRLPTVIALTMTDIAQRRSVAVDAAALASRLGCAVIPINPRTGRGLDTLRSALRSPRTPTGTPPADRAAFHDWVDALQAASAAAPATPADHDTFVNRLDRAFTNPAIGVAMFAAVMFGLFWLLFRIAVYPMNWISLIFTHVGGALEAALPAGLLRDLLTGGVLPGLAGALVFLPQICLLFFLLSLLEDTGYLARAAFVADRLLRKVGLPGHAFIPLLSSHACAIPGIMAARTIPNRRDRLATILVAPFMTCSARLPVYALLVTLLFPDSPSKAALAFVGCYALGAFAGAASALVAKGTILRGPGAAMALELPSYKWPSFRTAFIAAFDKGMVFLKKAGVFIAVFSVLLWWLSSFPIAAPPVEAVALRQQAATIVAPGEANALLVRADHMENQSRLSHSFAGRLGRALEPIFNPLGFDWRINIGVLSSFAAREVFVSTMSIVFTGDKEYNTGVLDASRQAVRDDGATPVFTSATSWSLLVFYVLAMQCFSTLVVTARETGAVRWAVLQFCWMTGLAYIAAFVTWRIAHAMGA